MQGMMHQWFKMTQWNYQSLTQEMIYIFKSFVQLANKSTRQLLLFAWNFYQSDVYSG